MGTVYRAYRIDKKTGERVPRRTYRISYINAQGKRTYAKGFKDKQASEAKMRRLEREAERARAGLLVVDPVALKQSFEKCVEKYVNDLERQGRGEQHRVNAKGSLLRMGRECNWKALGDVRVDQLTAFLTELQQQGRGARTTNSYRDYLCHFIDFCIGQRWLSENPFRTVKKAELGEVGRVRWRRAYTVEEFQRLLAVAGSRKALYQVAAYSGLRLSELARLQWRDARPFGERPTWHLRAKGQKGKRSVTIPMTPECAKVLQGIRPGSGPGDLIFAKIARIKTLHSDLRRAKVVRIDEQGRRLDFHSLRYFFCTQLARHLPIQKVKVLMRHKDIRQTANLYTDLGLEDVGEEVWTLPCLFAQPDEGNNEKSSQEEEE